MIMTNVTIAQEDPRSEDATVIMQELSDCLQVITGDSGKSSFDIDDICDARALFVIARNENGEPVGCGAVRQLSGKVAEIKRMYVKEKSHGLGSCMLQYLEQQAAMMGYDTVWLETRKINQKAVAFYLKNGYQIIPNYGRYKTRPEAVCFEKRLNEAIHEESRKGE